MGRAAGQCLSFSATAKPVSDCDPVPHTHSPRCSVSSVALGTAGWIVLSAVLVGVQCHLIVVLARISLTADDIEGLPVC